MTPVCTDDYGTEVHRCRYTHALTWATESKIIGATMPGVRIKYVMADTQEAEKSRKEAGIAFHEAEGNCNTCRHLQRKAEAKNKAAILSGVCLQTNKPLRFHPDDWMGMECYSSRWAI